MVNRRDFLRQSSIYAASAWLLGAHQKSSRADDGVQVSKLVAGKHDDLIILSSEPRVIETPLRLLREQTVTPKSILFVRNNSDPEGFMTVAPASRSNWHVDLTGLVEGDARLDASGLSALPQTEYEMVLQCSGNNRQLMQKVAPISGNLWGRGGIGNVRFGGPKFSTVLDHLKCTPRKLARFVCAEGMDLPRPKEIEFEHSIPLGDVLDTAILAITMNGEPLPAIHGGPVRLVTPGYYGTNHIKWLTKLRFEDEESSNGNHADRYRTPHHVIAPGSAYKFNLANSSPTWRMKIASMITSHGEVQPAPAGQTQTISGFAWNDGMVPLTGVLMSTDLGESWKRIQLQQAESTYAWSRWTAQLEVPANQSAPIPVWIAAVDQLGRTQPLDGGIHWNPRGYEWNGVERMTLTIG